MLVILGCMWIDTGSRTLPAGVEEQLVALRLVRDDRSDNVWVNIDTGATLILACDGGWRHPNSSRFLIFFRAPGGVDELLDVTHALTEQRVSFDPTQTGSGTYDTIREEIIQDVSARISATSAFRL